MRCRILHVGGWCLIAGLAAGAARAQAATPLLKELQQRGTRRIAVIETSGAARSGNAQKLGAGETEPPKDVPQMSIQGTSLFDVGSGELRLSELTYTITVQMPMSPDSPSIPVEGHLVAKLAVLPPTADKPARPARRNPAARSRGR
jgi:hypothetical protein